MPKNNLKDIFLEIKHKIVPEGKYGTIFGKRIDENNLEDMVIAAYYLAKQEEFENNLEKLGIVF